MKALSCKDISPASTCNFVAQDETEDGVVAKMMEHAMANHPEDVKSMSEKMSQDEIMQMMKSKVHDAA